MTTPFASFRALTQVALLAVSGAIAVACGGSFTSDPGNATQRVKPGDACAVSGATATSVDGCNTCTCASGAWACTEKACAAEDGGTALCQAGATRPAGDGCNTCTCESGAWACTVIGCQPPPVCKDGDTRGSGCGACWCQGGGWVCSGGSGACPPPICTEGQTKMDACNSCSCSGGQWACTAKACPPPACNDGATKYDGCNTCSCSGGQWQCTLIACVYDGGAAIDAGPAPKGCGGWLGDTCTASEYCAYVVGQMCGAADASATCQPRPQACDAIYDPVCGCDGKTYGNGCTAAMAGTGVNHAGVCN